MSFLLPRRHERAWDAKSFVSEARQRRQSGRGKYATVSRDDALRHSAVWACLRLRADLVSTMPVDAYRRIDGQQVEVTKPTVLTEPDGGAMTDWLYASQFDLDSTGNAIGVIRAWDGQGLPAVIELAAINTATVQSHKGKLTYRIDGKSYDPREVWHEKQYVVSGLPVGLSPIAHAALSIGGYLSAAEFAHAWFGNSAVPATQLKNSGRTLTQDQIDDAKARYRAAIQDGDVFVTGSDWELSMMGAKASETAFLEQQKFSVADVCRFLGVPGDMIDAETATGSITYANVTQRNLQLLIMNIGPAIYRRETALSRLLPRPRYVKLNTDAILRMDLRSRYDSYGVAIDKRFMTPTEARELENRPPFTPEQEAEFGRLFTTKGAQPTPPTGVPA